MTTTLFLARHGQTDWNFEHRWQGHADPPLNEVGRTQARELGMLLAGRGVSAVYSSDLRRASETAELAAAALGLPVVLDSRLREVDVGEWSGLTTAEVEARYPEGYRRRRGGRTGWTEGEELGAMARRVVAALLEIAEHHPGETVLVVSHGGPLRAAAAACGLEPGSYPNARNGDVAEIAVRDGLMRWLDSSRGGLHQQVQG
jgi:broad specificity phosphatase PhoE